MKQLLILLALLSSNIAFAGTEYVPPAAYFTAVSAADIVNTTSTLVKAAAGTGVRYYITAFSVTNSAAAVSTRVDLLDGATVIWSCQVGPAATGTCNQLFPTPLRGTTATALNCQAATTAAAVRCSIAGYTATY